MAATPIPAIEIDADGDCHTLYNEAVNLQAVGRVVNVHRASWVKWSESCQVWFVECAKTGRQVFADPSRAACIAWEIEHFQPGGELYRRQEH